jgi:hypothetical protein
MKVNGWPIVQSVIEYWLPRAHKVVVVSRVEDEEAMVKVTDDYDRASTIAVHTANIPMAIMRGLQQNCPQRFVVSLGDCLLDGEFDGNFIPLLNGVGVMGGDSDFARSYAVGDGVYIEKPVMGMGVYFFTWFALPALNSEKSITDVLVKLSATGFTVEPFTFRGDYLNVTYPEDLDRWTPKEEDLDRWP